MSDEGGQGSGSGDADEYIINCVSFFHRRGIKSRNEFLRKEKFRARMHRLAKGLKSLKNLKEIVCKHTVSTFNNFFLQNLCYIKFSFEIHTLAWSVTDTFYSFICMIFSISHNEYSGLI